jgi:hypothetical protein
VWPTELPNRLASLELSDCALLLVAPFVGSFFGVVFRRLVERQPIV